jgi:hypothetical protein
MLFRKSFFALRATKAAQAIAMCTEALTLHFARLASHCDFGLCCALHSFIITANYRCFKRKDAISVIFIWFALNGLRG